MQDLSIIIVNYNGGELLFDTVQSVFNTVPKLCFTVIIVDNGSTDGSVQKISKSFPCVRLIQNSVNLGFSKANNLGISQYPAACYLLLNSDVIVPEAAIETVLSFLKENEKVGVATPNLVYADGTDQLTARQFPTPMNAVFGRKSPLTAMFPNNRFSRRYMPEIPKDGQQGYSIDWISGAFFMVKDEVCQQAGLLDEGYFFYWEDADWCYRIRQKGWEIYCLPNLQVVHLEGGSSSNTSNRLIVEFHRSILRFYVKNYLTSTLHPLYLPAFCVIWLRCFLCILAKVFKLSLRKRI